MIGITIDSRDIREVSRQLAAMPSRIPQAIAAALNAGLPPARRALVNGIVEATTLKKSKAMDRVLVSRASPSRLEAGLKLTRRPAGAINFDHTLGGGGATFRFMRNDPTTTFPFSPRVFKAAGKNGNVHLFFRKSKKRLPIKAVYGPRLATILQRAPSIVEAANEAASEAVRRRLYSQIDRFLRRSKTTAPAVELLP